MLRLLIVTARHGPFRPEPQVQNETNPIRKRKDTRLRHWSEMHRDGHTTNVMGNACILFAKLIISTWANNALARGTSFAHWFAEYSTDTTISLVIPNDDINNRHNAWYSEETAKRAHATGRSKTINSAQKANLTASKHTRKPFFWNPSLFFAIRPFFWGRAQFWN